MKGNCLVSNGVQELQYFPLFLKNFSRELAVLNYGIYTSSASEENTWFTSHSEYGYTAKKERS